MFLGLFGGKNKKVAKEPQYLENELGRFRRGAFGKTMTLYEGSIAWCDKAYDVEANIICRADSRESMEVKFEYLRRILANNNSLDKELKEYIVKQNTEDDGLIHIWGDGESDEEPAPITSEAFISMLHLTYIRIYEDTTAEFVFPADGIFTDHEIVVRADNDLQFTDCFLQG